MTSEATTSTSSTIVRLYLPLLCVGFLLSLSLPFHSRISSIDSHQHGVDDVSPHVPSGVGDPTRDNRSLVARKPWVPDMSYDEEESASGINKQREFTPSAENGNTREVGANSMRDESIMPASAVIRGMGRGGRGGRKR